MKREPWPWEPVHGLAAFRSAVLQNARPLQHNDMSLMRLTVCDQQDAALTETARNLEAPLEASVEIFLLGPSARLGRIKRETLPRPGLREEPVYATATTALDLGLWGSTASGPGGPSKRSFTTSVTSSLPTSGSDFRRVLARCPEHHTSVEFAPLHDINENLQSQSTQLPSIMVNSRAIAALCRQDQAIYILNWWPSPCLCLYANEHTHTYIYIYTCIHIDM